MQSSARSSAPAPAKSTTHEAEDQAPASPIRAYKVVHEVASRDELPTPLHLVLGLWFKKSEASYRSMNGMSIWMMRKEFTVLLQHCAAQPSLKGFILGVH